MKKGNNGVLLGIDASRNRSGGAKAHLIGILSVVLRDIKLPFMVRAEAGTALVLQPTPAV